MEGEDDYPTSRCVGEVKLNDAALVYEPERRSALNFGFHVGS